jgi:CubicO group peptidase (beta-lactamase class C family)
VHLIGRCEPALVELCFTPCILSTHTHTHTYTFDYPHESRPLSQQVTTRHLLGQSSGYGILKPGSVFSYDSNDYIQHLSYLIDAVVTDDTPTGWSTTSYAEPLGVPDLFAYDGEVYGIGDNISTGGGQMMSCRDVARVGTLVVNKGLWPTADDSGARLVSAEYIEAMGQPSFPSFNKGYGFLTWLNTNVGSDGPHCCAPRWSSVGYVNQTLGNASRVGSCCATLNGSNVSSLPCDLFATNSLNEENGINHRILYEGSQYIERSIIDDNTPAELPQAPHDLMMGQGSNGQYLFIIPSLNLSVVTMGSSLPKSKVCFDGYDDAFTVSLAWNAISGAFQPSAATQKQSRAGIHPSTTKKARRSTLRALRPAAVTGRAGVVGSCQCDCPSNQGFGRCFDVAQNDIPPHTSPFAPGFSCLYLKVNGTVGRKIHSASRFCPQLGVTVACDTTRHTNASLLCRNHLRRCAVLKECGPVEGMPENFAVATCACPTPISMNPCVWNPKPCAFTPYYIPG